MRTYPFDSQECNATLGIETESDFFVKLVASDLKYAGPEDLMKYVYKNISLICSENLWFCKDLKVRQIMDLSSLPPYIMCGLFYTTN